MTAPAHSRRSPVVGRVESVELIPDSDRIRLARVDIGTGSFLAIVFGGEYQVTRGDLVPVAPPGSWVPGPRGLRTRPMKVRRRNFRGQRSEGMLCSLLELGWARDRASREAPETRNRVVVLKPVLHPGQPLPTPDRWREVVAHPDPAEFDPNTVELSTTEIEEALGAGTRT
jgi:tRNA-binding EMAP/Myf-like protein